MNKKYIGTIAMICMFAVTASTLVGCADGSSDSVSSKNESSFHNDGVSSIQSGEEGSKPTVKTPEEQAKEQKYNGDNKKANEKMKAYKYTFGDSEVYKTEMAKNTAGSNVPVFLEPEKAFQQSMVDYKDEYNRISEKFEISIPKLGDLDAIKEFAKDCYQAGVSDNALQDLRCSYLGNLLYAYANSYNKAQS